MMSHASLACWSMFEWPLDVSGEAWVCDYREVANGVGKQNPHTFGKRNTRVLSACLAGLRRRQGYGVENFLKHCVASVAPLSIQLSFPNQWDP